MPDELIAATGLVGSEADIRQRVEAYRAAGTDENLTLSPPIRFSLEQALEFIDDDELVEVTPESIRLRKKLLTETERKRAKNTKL